MATSANLNEIKNIFDDVTLVKDYQPRWKVLSSRQFNAKEQSLIDNCKVVAGDYGLSICFAMQNGHKRWISLDSQSQLNLGDTPEVKDIVIKIIQSTVNLTTDKGNVLPKGTKKLVCDAVEPKQTVEDEFDNPLGL